MDKFVRAPVDRPGEFPVPFKESGLSSLWVSLVTGPCSATREGFGG
jgi:hypothetical protein